ncbi:MAG: nitronate monooxygenase [Proteobacteria bacterium]|nr:nitronate monooxygenase [Pseudomonadota bacterium]
MPDAALAQDARATGAARLEQLWARGRAFLGTRTAILGGAMTWVSDHALVAAISNAGGFGILATGSMSATELDAEIARTRDSTGKPFGVNVLTMHPDLHELCRVCLRRGVGHVVLAGGLPRLGDVAQLKDGGTRVLAFAPSLGFAQRLVRGGVDGIIIEGAEAGGHIGPVSAAVLAQEILPDMRGVPVFVAGGIGRGEAIAMYLEMGASGCQLGTRFVCATESIAHPAFKQAFVRARARDALPTVQIDPRFPVIPVRALANAGTRRFHDFQREVIDQYHAGEISKPQAQLKIEQFWAGRLRAAVIDGDVENGSLMAGQSVGMVRSVQPTAEIMSELVDQAIAALAAAP